MTSKNKHIARIKQLCSTIHRPVASQSNIYRDLTKTPYQKPLLDHTKWTCYKNNLITYGILEPP